MTSHAAVIDDLLPAPAAAHRLDSIALPAFMYPAGTRLVEAIGAEDVAGALQQRGSGRGVGRGPALGLRINIPFCHHRVEGCTCMQVVTRRPECAARYLQGVRDEIALAARWSGRPQEVCAIHVGGASPLFMSDEHLAQLLDWVRASFLVQADAEISIEVATVHLTPGRVVRLREAGFDRLFVRLADAGCGGRRQDRLLSCAWAAREAGFASVAADLPCGARSSRGESPASRVQRVVAMRADRVRLICALATAQAPRPGCRTCCHEQLLSAGHVHLGMNEFALESSALAAAFRHGCLQLGVGGYSVKREPDVLALGVSAMGRIGSLVYRNVDALTPYYAALAHRRLPVARGLALGREELARRGVITGLLCQGRVDFESINLSHLIDMRTLFRRELALLEPLMDAGLVSVDCEAIELTAAGRRSATMVTSVFDRELQRDILRHRQATLDHVPSFARME